MSTFGQLKTDVDAWLARDDVAVSGSDFPSITLIAEAYIAADVRTVVQETNDTLSVTGRSVDVPADFLELRWLYQDTTFQREVEYMTPEALRASPQWNGQTGGFTMFYTIEGDGLANQEQFTFAPEGSATTPPQLPIGYWARFPALVNDPDTNWLIQNYYPVYLYAMLRASGEYLQEEALEDRYAAKYDDWVFNRLPKAENRKRARGNTLQTYGNPRSII